MTIKAARSTLEKDTRLISPTRNLRQRSADNTAVLDQRITFHAIRASLVTITGYSKALDSTFIEMTQLYDAMRMNPGEPVDPQATCKLMQLEADCRFYVSRLCRSVEQLRKQLKIDDLLSKTGIEENRQ